MAEPDTQPHAEGTLSAVQRLMQSINKPPKTSSDFASSSSRTQARNTNSFRAIAAAPSTEDPATAVSLANLSKAGKSRKRKASKDEGEGAAVKKKRGPKAKKEVSKPVLKLKGKKTATIPELPGELWVRIAEFCAPKDFNKLRLVCRSINGALVHWQNQVRQGQIREWYPEYMPKTFANLNEQQYNNLLGAGKGCMAPGCQDKRASKTYWPFARRWCADCYQKYTMKWRDFQRKHMEGFRRGDQEYVHTDSLLICLPYGICDSYGKPHHSIVESPPPHDNPKLHRICDVEAAEKILKWYMDELPGPYVSDPNLTDAENASALTAHDQMRDDKRAAREVELKAMAEKNKQYMQDVVKIEEGIKESQKKAKEERAAYRAKRRALFSEKAVEAFPDTSLEILTKLKPYISAIRNSQPVTSRCWEILKPKMANALLERQNASSTPDTMTPDPSTSAYSSNTTPAGSRPSTSAGETPNRGSSQQFDSTPSSTVPSVQSSGFSTPAVPTNGLHSAHGQYESDILDGFFAESPTPSRITESAHGFYPLPVQHQTGLVGNDSLAGNSYQYTQPLGLTTAFGHSISSSGNSSQLTTGPFGLQNPTAPQRSMVSSGNSSQLMRGPSGLQNPTAPQRGMASSGNPSQLMRDPFGSQNPAASSPPMLFSSGHPSSCVSQPSSHEPASSSFNPSRFVTSQVSSGFSIFQPSGQPDPRPLSDSRTLPYPQDTRPNHSQGRGACTSYSYFDHPSIPSNSTQAQQYTSQSSHSRYHATKLHHK